MPRIDLKRIARDGAQLLKRDGARLLSKAAAVGKEFARKNPRQSAATVGGGAAGTALGLALFGGAGVGIAAFGSAIGVPLALLTALVGTGLGNRLGVSADLKKLVEQEEERANARYLQALNHSKRAERIIGKEEHEVALLKALADATDTVCIRSGFIWVNQVRQLLGPLKQTLTRGVNVYVEYGFRSVSDARSGDMPPEERESLELLKALAEGQLREGNGRLMVGRTATHIKQVIVDGEYVLLGSNNWLSNASHLNRERRACASPSRTCREKFAMRRLLP